MRRAKGVVGALRPGESSSSIALSSMESDRSVETLPRRPPKPKGLDCVGEVPAPDRPRVEIDMRRRWSWEAAVVMGRGKGPVGAPDVLLERPNMLLKVCVVKEPRRGRPETSLGLDSLFDIMGMEWGALRSDLDEKS
jgi:hypothetical protein